MRATNRSDVQMMLTRRVTARRHGHTVHNDTMHARIIRLLPNASDLQLVIIPYSHYLSHRFPEFSRRHLAPAPRSPWTVDREPSQCSSSGYELALIAVICAWCELGTIAQARSVDL
eukprot:4709042-Pleurochrysis_carterae.AAC.6